MAKHNIRTYKDQYEVTKAFLDWQQALIKKYGNKPFESERLVRLEIELIHELRVGETTLAAAEEAYLRSSGMMFFGTTSPVDLQ